MPEYYLKPKLALITGASGVIGNSIVSLLAENNNLKLLITGRDEVKLEYLKNKLNSNRQHLFFLLNKHEQ